MATDKQVYNPPRNQTSWLTDWREPSSNITIYDLADAGWACVKDE